MPFWCFFDVFGAQRMTKSDEGRCWYSSTPLGVRYLVHCENSHQTVVLLNRQALRSLGFKPDRFCTQANAKPAAATVTTTRLTPVPAKRKPLGAKSQPTFSNLNTLTFARVKIWECLMVVYHACNSMDIIKILQNMPFEWNTWSNFWYFWLSYGRSALVHWLSHIFE